jgi:hypothetical protein
MSAGSRFVPSTNLLCREELWLAGINLLFLQEQIPIPAFCRDFVNIPTGQNTVPGRMVPASGFAGPLVMKKKGDGIGVLNISLSVRVMQRPAS